jgi:hypothetical protein
MKANRFIILSFFTLASSSLLNANEVENTPIVEADSIKTAVVSNESSKSSGKLKTFMKKANPSLQFGGFIVGKYSIDDKRSESKSYNNSFDMRYLRLYANGYCFDDFYYRFQLEVNGSPGDDKGPRLLDAFVEW